MRISSIALPIVIALCGCSAKLAVAHLPGEECTNTSSTKTCKPGEPKGIVYRTPITKVVISRKNSYTPDRKAPCKVEPVNEFVTLPLGTAYTVNIDDTTAWFASNGISMAFTDHGVLKQVSLNSDPQIDETIAATASLVKEVGAVASAGTAGVALADAELGKDQSACGAVVETEILCVKDIDDWTREPNCPTAQK